METSKQVTWTGTCRFEAIYRLWTHIGFKISCKQTVWGENLNYARFPLRHILLKPFYNIAPVNFLEKMDRSHLILLVYYGDLLSYYLTNKRSLHIRSQGVEIFTLIRENKKNINYPPLAL